MGSPKALLEFRGETFLDRLIRCYDTLVVDEPLYAHYLTMTGADHPGREEIIASQPISWRLVAEALTGPLPDGDEPLDLHPYSDVSRVIFRE